MPDTPNRLAPLDELLDLVEKEVKEEPRLELDQLMINLRKNDKIGPLVEVISAYPTSLSEFRWLVDQTRGTVRDFLELSAQEEADGDEASTGSESASEPVEQSGDISSTVDNLVQLATGRVERFVEKYGERIREVLSTNENIDGVAMTLLSDDATKRKDALRAYPDKKIGHLAAALSRANKVLDDLSPRLGEQVKAMFAEESRLANTLDLKSWKDGLRDEKGMSIAFNDESVSSMRQVELHQFLVSIVQKWLK